MTIFYCLRFKAPPNWMARSPYYIPKEQGGPVIAKALGSLFVASYNSQDYHGGT
jgi:hypothetical protein